MYFSYPVLTDQVLMAEIDLYSEYIARYHPTERHYSDLSCNCCVFSSINTELPVRTIKVHTAKKFHRN